MRVAVVFVLVACGLSCIQAKDRPHTSTCVCKPVLKLEWYPTASICNNATFDWLMQTVLDKVSIQSGEIDNHKKSVSDLEASVQKQKEDIQYLEEEKHRLENENYKLKQEAINLVKDIDSVKEDLKVKKDWQPKDCADIQRLGFHYSGVYTLFPDSLNYPLDVFCDLQTDGGGWTVIQRRQDGSQRFDRSWNTYKWGFGKLAKEFWLGNEKIHSLSDQRVYELRVDLVDYEGKKYYASYNFFGVGDEKQHYALHLGKYEGNAGDSLTHHNHAPFSTYDRDHDQSKSGNCPNMYGGGWWYVRCYDANLNGRYMNKHAYDAVVWYHLKNNHESLRRVEMKIRPVGYRGEL